MSIITITANSNRVTAYNGDIVVLPKIGDNITNQIWITVSGSVTLRPNSADKINGVSGDSTITANTELTNSGSSSWYTVNPTTSLSGYARTDTSYTWTAPQTFKLAKFQDSDQSNSITLNFGNESADRNLSVPQLGQDANILCDYAASNQFIYTGMGFVGTLYVINGSGVNINTSSQSAFRTALFPTLNSDVTIHCGLSGTVTFTAGSASITNANIHTGDKIFLSRVSGSTVGTISGYTITDGVGATITATNNDDGVWNYIIVK